MFKTRSISSESTLLQNNSPQEPIPAKNVTPSSLLKRNPFRVASQKIKKTVAKTMQLVTKDRLKGKVRSIDTAAVQSDGRLAEEPVAIDGGAAGVFNLKPNCLPPSLTTSQEDIIKEIGQKIERGYALAQKIRAGEPPKEPCSPKDETDLLWFFYAQAEKKGGSFASGAMTVEDPGHLITAFLDSNPEMYQRDSTHVPEFQKNEGATHRGWDNNKSKVVGDQDFDFILPHGRRTLLYGPIKEGAPREGIAAYGCDMIYLKLEAHGARLYESQDPKSKKGVNPSRSMNAKDLKNAVGHAAGYLQSVSGAKTDEAGGSRREVVPKPVMNAYKNILKVAAQSEEGFEGILLKNEATSNKSAGIRTLHQNLDELQKFIDDNKKSSSCVDLQVAIDAFYEKLKSLGLNDNIDLRFGNEVILMQKDLFGS